MMDEYSGYKKLFTQDVIELGCLAHARRKFVDLNAAAPNAIAQEALARIAALYAVEARGKDLTVAERARLRQEEALPLLKAMHEWLLATRLTVAYGGGGGEGVRRWAAFSRYAMVGDLPIDNNPVENAIRPIAIGKKNWLFVGSERAGERATAKLNGLDPYAWLRETLEKLPTCPNSLIDSLLPLRVRDGESDPEGQQAAG